MVQHACATALGDPTPYLSDGQNVRVYDPVPKTTSRANRNNLEGPHENPVGAYLLSEDNGYAERVCQEALHSFHQSTTTNVDKEKLTRVINDLLSCNPKILMRYLR